MQIELTDDMVKLVRFTILSGALFFFCQTAAQAEPASFMAQANRLISQRKLSEAISLYELYNKKNPGDLQAIYHKLVLLDTNQKVAAIADCTALIQADPQAKRFTNVYTYRANAYLNDDEVDKAWADINKSIALKQESPVRYIVSYRLHQTRSEFKEAQADIDHLLSQAKDGGHRSYFYKIRALNYESLKMWDKALSDWTSAIKENPRDASNLRERARLFESRQMWEQAIKDYSGMIKIDAQDELAYERRGKVNFKVGRYKDSASDLSTALRLDPVPAATTYEARAAAYEKLGEKALAQKDRESARKTRDRY